MCKLGLPSSKIKEYLDQTSLCVGDKKIIQELIEQNNKEIEKEVASALTEKNKDAISFSIS
ncbi:hypothetical protein ACWV26_05105 [Rummeliibacillus sp. JY-2-4R]